MLEQPTNPLTPFKPVDSQSHEAVDRLRYEIENFKQTFSPSIVPVNFIFDPEMTLNFLSLEI